MSGVTTDDHRKTALNFLTEIEQAEAALLTWGVVDGAFSADELQDRARVYLNRIFDVSGAVPFGSPDELLDLLKAELLLFELPARLGFRTRTAEGIRLLFRLKQLFPKHAKNGGWETAANLVADYRLLLRERNYPKRDIEPAVVQDELLPSVGASTLSREVLQLLLEAESKHARQLSRFQVDAAKRVLAEYTGGRRRSGTIVCAGTGSGKTLAFYIPALLMLAELSSPERWVRALAVYPRNELLKDQLSTAVREVSKINPMLRRKKLRPVVVGVLFGAVPKRHSDKDTIEREWPMAQANNGRGRQCPFLNCPDCGEGLIWLDTERGRGEELLHCLSPTCKRKVDSSEFLFTRDAMVQTVPDLLFTNLEMVNQRLSDVRTWPLLGVGIQQPERRPRLVLLDEVHTYDGLAGAQAALVLRRWQRSSGAVPHFVGLSATLEDAGRFFSELTGVSASLVKEITPATSDLELDGQEVLLALRGDPISRKSLLSTSIQAAMLIRRILNPANCKKSMFGTKVFAFTDDLDVTNRLFHDLQDAEGWDVSPRTGQKPVRPSLASLRSPAAPDHRARFIAGQSWDLSEQIGHDLTGTAPVRVGRTSSQDSGVDRSADIVVATASLEVGFDDPEVGAVLQHKAPRDSASFLQRKGRAGRPRGTRPWTLVVLSDYGRDRIAYQGYEQLFSPRLRPRHLPIRNRHVLRIQAVYALMDWLAAALVTQHGDKATNLWAALSGPPKDDSYLQFNKTRLNHVAMLVDQILTTDRDRRTLSHYLQQALGIESEVAERLLWETPRSLMLVVLPTILRRIGQLWQVARLTGLPPATEPWTSWAPLPEFIPHALFADLNLPEVLIELPDESRPPYMPVLSALREFAPGRVTRRFGIARRDERHWIPLPDDDGDDLCNVDKFCSREDRAFLGRFRYQTKVGIEEIDCLRPYRLIVQSPPKDVSTSSNARLDWRTQLLPRVQPPPAQIPQGCIWCDVICSLSFYTHNDGNPVEVRRFAVASLYDLRREGRPDRSGIATFAVQEQSEIRPVALGFVMDADAIRLDLSPPDTLFLLVQSNDRLLRGLRTAYFTHLMRTDPSLDGVANVFQRDWLVQICLSALTLEALERKVELRTAAESVFRHSGFMPLEAVLDVVLRGMSATEDGRGADDLRIDLGALLRNASVMASLEKLASTLWSYPDRSWEPWLRDRFLSTLGCAVLNACQNLCPDMDDGDLYVDLQPGPRGAAEGCQQQVYQEVWLSESSVGGGGVVESLTSRYIEDPRRFFRLVDAALGPSEWEDVDSELDMLLGWLVPGSDEHRRCVLDAICRVRQAETHEALVIANDSLRLCLSREGLATTHAVMTAVQARILRPGSSEATDELLLELVRSWKAAEQRLGVEIDARVLAYVRCGEETLDSALKGALAAPGGAERRPWRFSVLCGLLWPRGTALRSQSLSAYNPFSLMPSTDRWIVHAGVPRKTSEVRMEQQDWQRQLCVALVRHGSAVLSASIAQRSELRRAIHHMLVEPVDTDLLLVYPIVASVRQEGLRLFVEFDVMETHQ